MKLVLGVVFTILVASCSANPVSTYNCATENAINSPKLSLIGWNAITEEEYRAVHTNCLINGASDYTELAKCIDKTTDVIDSNQCYLIPRAAQQYTEIFGLPLSEIEDIVRGCYEANLKGQVKNYEVFYQCIQGA
ncbi:hypothetical protein ACFFRR_003675 [Megaselia abdita]